MFVILFIFILMAIVFVHELGHFLAAKRFGIRVDEFGLGFPPKILGKKFGETEYTLNALPIGGFVRIFGEDPDDENTHGPDRERSFVHKAKWKQAVVLVAGVTFNVLFAWLLFFSLFLTGMPTALDESNIADAKDPKLLITNILPDSPAGISGLKAADQILSVTNGTTELTAPLTPEKVSDFISQNNATPLNMTILRGGQEQVVSITPQTGVIADNPDRAAAGFVMALSGTVALPFHEALWESIKMTGEMLVAVTVGLVQFFGQAFTFTADLSQVAGPVGIAGIVKDASSIGIASVVMLTAFISLNLAVINLLPFPALDGGRLVMVAIEAIKGSPIKPAIANTINRVGFAFLLLLMVAVTFNDIVKLF